MKTNSFENALRDDHHKTYTFLKTKSGNFEPKKLIHRSFKEFDIDEFKWDICNSMSAMRTLQLLKAILFKF